MHYKYIGLALLFAVVASDPVTYEQSIKNDVGEESDSVSEEEDPTFVPAGTLDMFGNVLDTSRIVKTLMVTNGARWGTWGAPAFCPTGSYAAGYDMKIEPKQGNGDDTSLNAINIICKDTRDDYVATHSSKQGQWGNWVGRTYCHSNNEKSTDFMASYALQVEEPQGHFSDDTAANYVRFMCRGLTESNSHNYLMVKPPGHGFFGIWGAWSESCPENTAICGIKTRVEKNQYLLDDTALNDAIFFCCK